MSMLTGAQLRDRLHRGRDPRGLSGERHRPQRLVLALDVVEEMLVVGQPKDEHPLRLGGPVEQLADAGQRYRRVVFRGQIQRRDVTAHWIVSSSGRTPGLGCALPPGPSATTARTRGSASGV